MEAVKPWNELNFSMISELLDQKQDEYIFEKTNYFFNNLMNNLVLKKEVKKAFYLLEDSKTNEEYVSYHNDVLNTIFIRKKRPLGIMDFFKGSTKEMVWEKGKQCFITLDNNLLRVDVLYSYIDVDMVTSFYRADDILKNVRHLPNYLWELISSNNIRPFITITSKVRANIDGYPKDQVIYSLKDGEEELVLHAQKMKDVDFNPFDNHFSIVDTALKLEKDLNRQRKWGCREIR